MILTVNIHPTAMKVARSGQGGRNVAIEMTDATGSTIASIFPGTAEGWNELVRLAIEGRAMQEQADTDHAIAADLRRDGEALGHRIAADEGIEPEQLYVVVNLHEGRAETVSDPRPKALAEQWAKHEAPLFPGQLEVAPASPEDLSEPKADPVPWPTGFCGHPVPPGAWAAGFHHCRDDIAAEQRPRFDIAARTLTVVDDEDGEQR